MRLTRIVASTQKSERAFWEASLLGRSLQLFPDALRPELKIRFDNRGEEGLPAIYNRAIEGCPPETYLLFVHDDVFLHDLFLQHRIAEALSRADVVGLAGSRGSDLNQPSWGLAFDENLRPTGWQPPRNIVLSGAVSHVAQSQSPHDPTPEPQLSLYGNFPAECDLLDGLFLACNTALLQERNVCFDEQFHFHLYDLDFCRSARTKQLRLSTAAILASHGSGGNFDSDEFRAAARAYLNKWNRAAEGGAEAAGFRLPARSELLPSRREPEASEPLASSARLP